MGYSMENVYVKVNGSTKKYTRPSEKEAKMYHSKNYDVLSFLKGYESIMVSNGINYDFSQSLEYIKKNNPDVYSNILDILFIKIFFLESKEEIIDLNAKSCFAEDIMTSYNLIYGNNEISEGYINHVKQAHETKDEEFLLTVYNRIIKNIVSDYIKDYIDGLSDDEITLYKGELYKGKNPLQFIIVGKSNLEKMDKAKLIDSELRNFIAATFNYHLYRKTIKGRKHLCFDCPVDTNKCPKTMDDPYLNIEDYHFILDGEEVTHYETACTEVEEEGVTPSAYSTTDDEKFKRVDKVEKIDTYQVYRCKKYDYAKKQQKLRRKNRP